MQLRDRSRPAAIAQAIERYVESHPNAADSEQGITEWWLPAMGVDASLATVRAALRLLVRRGVLERRPLPGRAVIFGAARRGDPRRIGSKPHGSPGSFMANIAAIHSVGNSLVTFLRNTYPAQLDGRAMPTCSFDLMCTGQLAGDPEEGTRIGLLLYRVTVDEHARQLRGSGRDGVLSLDLHYLLTAWASNALDEQLPFAWAMRQLHLHPVLDASSLSPEARWAADEVVQLVPAELATEDVMRIWDALEPSYRLSASYVARIVRIDPDSGVDAAPVVATRFVHGQLERP